MSAKHRDFPPSGVRWPLAIVWDIASLSQAKRTFPPILSDNAGKTLDLLENILTAWHKSPWADEQYMPVVVTNEIWQVCRPDPEGAIKSEFLVGTWKLDGSEGKKDWLKGKTPHQTKSRIPPVPLLCSSSDDRKVSPILYLFGCSFVSSYFDQQHRSILL